MKIMHAVLLLAAGPTALLAPLAYATTAVGLEQPGMAREKLYERGMHVIITGSGSALADPMRGGASVAVTVDGEVLQFDLGRNALENGLRAGLLPTDIDKLFFTHLHFDHIASYGYFLISNWIAGRIEPVQVFGPQGTVAMNDGAYAMNASNIAFGHDVYKNWPDDSPGRIAAEPPFVVKDIEAGKVASGPGYTVTAMHTVHYTYPGAQQKSLAYRVDTQYGSVVISGDVGPMDEMAEFAKGVDILVHEVQRPDPGMTSGGKMAKKSFSETKSGESRNGGGHTSASEVGRIAARAGAKMLVAYHLPPYTSGDAAVRLAAPYTGNFPGFQIWGDYIRAIAQSYSGKIVMAEDAMVFEIKRDKAAD